jgi:hypothetical protein
LVQVDRGWLVSEFGIPHRDLRYVDPEVGPGVWGLPPLLGAPFSTC